MNEAALERGDPLPREEVTTLPRWVRPTLLVVFCAGLLAAIGAVFTQVIAARVPEQRATLEKLITDRTGLAVRFDNVHFAWDMEGTSAVFERVELTDPARGRVRVVAPELRVRFDTWDFLRHQQFSLGHVTLSSPDIDIIGDAEPAPRDRPPVRSGNAVSRADEDEAALIRRFTAWAELMPVGRVEVEGARVHLFRRGERAARHNFTLSQAVVSRGSQNFNAFGTLLLSQDIGQSLFVSAKLEGMGGGAAAASNELSGELRFIARRVFLERLPMLARSANVAPAALRGRGTVDARLALRGGRIGEGRWQLSGRELQMPGGARFDHFTVQGRLARAADGFAVELTDLQVTRGARLERAPRITTHLSLTPGSMRIARVTARAERVPFLAAQFLASAMAARPGSPGVVDNGWSVTAGELHDLRFDSRDEAFSARASGVEIVRAADRARISDLAAAVELHGGRMRFNFDGASGARLGIAETERPLQLSGALTVAADSLEFAELRVQTPEAVLTADGSWRAEGKTARPLLLEMSGIDRSLAADAWSLVSLEPPRQFADLHGGRIVAGRMSLVPAASTGQIDWQRSQGSMDLADLASGGTDVPRLTGGSGRLQFASGAVKLRLEGGTLEDLRVSNVRVDWPRRGAPRLRAQAEGDLASPLLRRALAGQGLDELTGTVALDAEARGESEMRDPASWRVTARVREASLPLAAGLPPVEKLGGTVRLAGGELRGVALEGRWLGGAVNIETRRTGSRPVSSAHVDGIADAAPLLELLGQGAVARQVSGQAAWSGTVQRREATPERAAGWQLSLAANLAGVESRLPAPFDKPRSRALPINAELHFDAQGLQEYEIESGRDSVRGRVQRGVIQTTFAVRGVTGEFRAAVDSSDPRLTIDRLEVRQAPAVLAAAGALLPDDRELAVQVADLRHANRPLGALTAAMSRQSGGLEFSLESAAGAVHRLDASGQCADDARCHLEFSASTRELPLLLGDAELPAEWPTRSLRASGELEWRAGEPDILAALAGRFDLETEGATSAHQLMATAVLADGHIELENVQGSGPEADQVFHGSGRVALAARTYDLTVDYEKVSLAASAVPTPARMRLSRAWSSLRGSVARRGWTETAPARRVQWHGSWDGD